MALQAVGRNDRPDIPCKTERIRWVVRPILGGEDENQNGSNAVNGGSSHLNLDREEIRKVHFSRNPFFFPAPILKIIRISAFGVFQVSADNIGLTGFFALALWRSRPVERR